MAVKSWRIEIEDFALGMDGLDECQIRYKPRRPPSLYI